MTNIFFKSSFQPTAQADDAQVSFSEMKARNFQKAKNKTSHKNAAKAAPQQLLVLILWRRG